jgi:hypothetical protein
VVELPSRDQEVGSSSPTPAGHVKPKTLKQIVIVPSLEPLNLVFTSQNHRSFGYYLKNITGLSDIALKPVALCRSGCDT